MLDSTDGSMTSEHLLTRTGAAGLQAQALIGWRAVDLWCGPAQRIARRIGDL